MPFNEHLYDIFTEDALSESDEKELLDEYKQAVELREAVMRIRPAIESVNSALSSLSKYEDDLYTILDDKYITDSHMNQLTLHKLLSVVHLAEGSKNFEWAVNQNYSYADDYVETAKVFLEERGYNI